MSDLYGFSDGKNKADLTPLFSAKQDQHIQRTATLTPANWSSSSQTVAVDGVTAENTVIVSPAPAFADAYTEAGIVCTAQAENSLTFTCTDTPSGAIVVNIAILGVTQE